MRARLLQFTPCEFEHFVRLLLEKSGFVRVSVTRASGDGGIDLNAYVEEANEFFAGPHVQAQVKRWRHAVGSPEINSFRGALSTTAKGVFHDNEPLHQSCPGGSQARFKALIWSPRWQKTCRNHYSKWRPDRANALMLAGLQSAKWFAAEGIVLDRLWHH